MSDDLLKRLDARAKEHRTRAAFEREHGAPFPHINERLAEQTQRDADYVRALEARAEAAEAKVAEVLPRMREALDGAAAWVSPEVVKSWVRALAGKEE